MIALIIIGIVFYNYAKKTNLNTILWIIIGIAGYFIPQFLLGLIIGLIAPQMVNERGILTIIGLAVGIIGSVIAYQIMVHYSNKAKEKPVDDSLLDSDIDI